MAGLSIGNLFLAGCRPVLRILLMVAFGILSARKGVVDKNARRALNQLVFLIFLPCLVLVAFSESVRVETISKWWPLLVNTCFAVAVGYVLGEVLVLVVRPPREMYQHIKAGTMVGNTSNLPLVLVTSLAVDEPEFFGPNAQSNGVAYAAISLITTVFAMFTIAYAMILNAPNACADEDDAAPHLTHVATKGLPPAVHQGTDTAALPSESPAPISEPYLALRQSRDGHESSAVSGTQPSQIAQSGDLAGLASHIAVEIPTRSTKPAVNGINGTSGSFQEDGGSPEQSNQTGPPTSGAQGNRVSDTSVFSGGNDVIGSSQSVTCVSSNEVQNMQAIPVDIWASAQSHSESGSLQQQDSAMEHAGGMQNTGGAGSPKSGVQWRPNPLAATSLVPGQHGATPPHATGDDSNPNPPSHGRVAVWRRVARRIQATAVYDLVVNKILTPPVLGGVLGATIGLAPPLVRTFVNDGAPLFFLTDALRTLGGAMIPCTMVALGASMHKGPGAGRVPVRLIVGMALARLVVAPVIGAGCVYALYRVGAFQVPDRMFLFVMFIMHAPPTSTNIQVVASIANSCELQMATLLFWQYLASIVTLPLALLVFLQLVEEVPLLVE